VSADYNLACKCLDEIDEQLLAVGQQKCNGLHDNTPRSAVGALLLRAVSLLRSSLGLLERGELDSYDIVRRAFYEAWLLALEFRMDCSQAKAARWHGEQSASWEADISKLESWSKSEGIEVPGIGRDYGGLSEVAHPTKKAAWHSIRVATSRHVGCQDVSNGKTKLEQTDLPALVHSLVWIMGERPGSIQMGADPNRLPNALACAREYTARLKE
jgi:hypothetical protein